MCSAVSLATRITPHVHATALVFAGGNNAMSTVQDGPTSGDDFRPFDVWAISGAVPSRVLMDAHRYRGTSLIRNSASLGLYSRATPRAGPLVVLGGWAASNERGTP